MKHFLYLLPAAGLLSLASCSNEDVAAPVGDDGTVTFEVSLPAAPGSRYGEGTVTKQLHYAVYDANNAAAGAIFASDVPGSPMADNSTIDFKLKLNLVKGKTYDFIFWADAVGNDFYKFSSEKKNVEITYGTVVKGNDEDRDAFFQAVKKVEVKGAMTQEVQLRRPFAQLNFGTDDIEVAGKASTVIASTKVKVEGAYTKLDLYEGIASDATTVEFTSSSLPSGQTFPAGSDYDYLTMDYILTGIELEPAAEGAQADVQKAKSEVMNATLTFTFTDNQTADVVVSNLPVQRNYRTNVFGSLLTAPMDLTIEVKPDFREEPGHVVEVVDKWDGTTVAMPEVTAEGEATVKTAAQFVGLAEALSNGQATGVKEVKLETSIDMGGFQFDGFGREGLSDPSDYASAYKSMKVKFDGQGKTIKNFSTRCNYRYANGLFANLSAGSEIKNLVVEGVTIGGVRQGNFLGIIAGYATGTTFENITVRNCVVSGFGKVGAIVGGCPEQNATTTFRNCVIENVTIVGGYNLGGLVGLVQHPHNIVIENCPEPAVTFKKHDYDATGDGASDYSHYAGAITHTKLKDGQGEKLDYTLPDVDAEFYIPGNWAHTFSAKWYCYMTREANYETSFLWFQLPDARYVYIAASAVDTPISPDNIFIPQATE